MAFLLDSVKEHLDHEFVAEVAQLYQQSDLPVAHALNIWSAAILAGLLNHVDNPKAMNRIFKGLDDFPPDLTDHPEALLRTGNLAQNDPREISGRLLGQLFGPKISVLNTTIAQISGASPDAVSRALGIAGPLLLSTLGRRLQAGELSISGLANLLRAEHDRLAAVLPVEIAEVLEATTLEAPDDEQLEPAIGTKWTLSLLLLLSLGAAVLLFTRFCTP